MSTDMQRYSIENQSEAIASYAARRGLEIVRSYSDAGKSGLRIKGRGALKSLIDDVTSRRANFEVILVYDVSRWGRFQDCDESAYYEYICKEAGVTVEYCAEEFENDGSLAATVMKSMKRAMAGEYSRELSVKVSAGLSRSVANGFHVGCAPIGFRRCLVDPNGNRKFELTRGEWKNLKTDRVILIPGPQREIKIVKSIYRMFVDDGMSINEIMRKLNAEGKWNAGGRPWIACGVKHVLTNEKYVGDNLYGMTSRKLGGRRRVNPRSQWTVATNAIEPIVSRKKFAEAQTILKDNRAFTANELLDSLTAIWCLKGTISAKAVAGSPFAPALNTYRRCFGGLMNAYPCLGFSSKRRIHEWMKRAALRKTIDLEILENVRRSGGRVLVRPKTGELAINDELWLSSSVARFIITHGKCRRWLFGSNAKRRPDILVVARMDKDGRCPRDYFILPYILIDRRWLTFPDGKIGRFEPFHVSSLEPLFEVLLREPIHRIAMARDQSAAASRDSDSTTPEAKKGDFPSIEISIISVIENFRDILSNQKFVDCMASTRLRSMPRLFSVPTSILRDQGKGLTASVLEFSIMWTFVSRLAENPELAFHLSRDWPDFLTKMKEVRLSIMARRPFASIGKNSQSRKSA